MALRNDDFIIRNFCDTTREPNNTYFRIQTTKNIYTYVEILVISQNNVTLFVCINWQCAWSNVSHITFYVQTQK